MDHYSAEKWMLDRHAAMAAAAERRSRLQPSGGAPLRAWMACHLRLLADRLEGATLAHPQRPTA
jgi:hypothetical protein